MSDLLTYRGTVYPRHCDHMGHMNVMWYVGKFDEATWHLFAQIGMTPSYLRESGRGMAAVQQNISYKRELLAGDIVEVRSRILELRDKVLRFAHDMDQRRDRPVGSKLRADRGASRSRRAQLNCIRGQGPRPGAEVDGLGQEAWLSRYPPALPTAV